jgi:hypothetical protein
MKHQQLQHYCELNRAFGLTLLLTGPVIIYINPYIGLPLFFAGVIFLSTGIEQSIRLYFLQKNEDNQKTP